MYATTEKGTAANHCLLALREMDEAEEECEKMPELISAIQSNESKSKKDGDGEITKQLIVNLEIAVQIVEKMSHIVNDRVRYIIDFYKIGMTRYQLLGIPKKIRAVPTKAAAAATSPIKGKNRSSSSFKSILTLLSQLFKCL